MINVGLVGFGYWAPNILRNLRDLPNVEVSYVCDTDTTKLERVKGVKTTTSLDDLIKGSEAVIVSTPAKTHYDIARRCLEAGKDVLVEKPLTYKPQDSIELIRLVDKQILMVGHILLYNNISRYIKQCDIGDIRYLQSQRLGLGPIRQDVNAMWDLAPHDIAFFNYILDDRPESVFVNGKSYVQKGIEDMVSMSLDYPNNCQANTTVSWIDPIKTRKITIVGSKKMLEFDDVIPRLTIFDKGVDYQPKTGEYGDFKLSLRDGDIILPKIPLNEPLKEELQHFLDCVKTRQQPLTDGWSGYDVVCTLDAAQRSLKSGKKEMIQYE